MSISQLSELPAQCADALTTDDMPRDPDEVLKRLWESLVRVMRRWVKTYQDAEDLAAQAVARVWSHLGATVPWREMWAWAVRVARRLLSNLRRDRGRERLEVCDLDSLASTAPSIDWRLLTEDTMAHLRSDLSVQGGRDLELARGRSRERRRSRCRTPREHPRGTAVGAAIARGGSAPWGMIADSFRFSISKCLYQGSVNAP